METTINTTTNSKRVQRDPNIGQLNVDLEKERIRQLRIYAATNDSDMKELVGEALKKCYNI